MERLKVAKKSSDMFILNGLILLLSAALASSNEAEENSGSGRPVWNIDQSTDRFFLNAESVEVKVGSNLTLSCIVDALDLQYEVFRISLIQGDVLFPLVENGLVHSPFSNIPRYTATMNEDGRNGGARMTIHVKDIQPEDAGTYICNKYMEMDNSAVVNVTILAPILDLYITSMDPDGEEMRMDAESEVFLQEHDFYGVGCVATVEGSQNPPQVRVEIDGKDETEFFQAIHQVDASVLQSGLTLWNSHLRLAFVSATPNPDYNEKLMRCIASQTGFPDVEASTRLLVQFAPLIDCIPQRLVVRQGTSATLDCNIRANPGSRITWSSARGDLSNYPNVFFDETVISSDETRLTLSIRNIQSINFQRYTLTAANIVSSSQSTFELIEDETVVVETQSEMESFSPEEYSILPEVVEEVFPGGYNDLPMMNADWFVENTSFAPEPSSTSPDASSTMLETSSSSVEEDKRTVAPPVVSTSSDVKSTSQVFSSTLQDVDNILPDATVPDVKNTLPHVKSTLPDVKITLPNVNNNLPNVKNILPDDKNTFQNVDSTLPLAKSTSPNIKKTFLDVRNTLPPVRTSSLDIEPSTVEVGFNLPDPTTTLPSRRRLSPSGKPHSAPGRARSAHHKGTSIPLKATRDALPVAAAAVPTEAPKSSVASSVDVEQPLPAAVGEVHYSHSRSSSSSSKKDSGKSGKANKSTSGASAIAVVQHLLASLLLSRWF